MIKNLSWLRLNPPQSNPSTSASDKPILEEAKKYGVGIIRQVGDGIEVNAKDLIAYH